MQKNGPIEKIFSLDYLERSARPPPLQLKGRTSGRREQGKGNKLIQNWDKLKTELGQNSALPEDGRQRKSCQNLSPEGPRDPKAPKIHPGSLPEQPWALKIHSFPQSRPEKGEKATQGRGSRPKVGESRPKVGPRDPPWGPAGSQNRPKIRPGTEEGPLRTPRAALFATFGVHVRPESRFSSMFDHFLDDFGEVGL